MAKIKLAASPVEEVFTLTAIQEVDMFVDQVTDAAGNPIVDENGLPATVENVTWTVSDPLILNVVNIAPDGKAATIRTTGKLTPLETATQVTVNADVLVGEAEHFVTSIRSFRVIVAAAAAFSTGLGTPRDRILGT